MIITATTKSPKINAHANVQLSTIKSMCGLHFLKKRKEKQLSAKIRAHTIVSLVHKYRKWIEEVRGLEGTIFQISKHKHSTKASFVPVKLYNC